MHTVATDLTVTDAAVTDPAVTNASMHDIPASATTAALEDGSLSVAN